MSQGVGIGKTDRKTRQGEGDMTVRQDRDTRWIADIHPPGLANRAESYDPDSGDSPGARFLRIVADGVAEMIEYADIWEGETRAEVVDRLRDAGTDHENADGAVPIYTHEVWSTFADLGAWQEDPTELGADGSDMEQAAKTCLYMIAERLTGELLSEWVERGEEGASDDR